ncbi:polysaccharide pyruvyl transferase CsaB [Proteocatella sphenisci]|uniref:polysaccharide pyruvyl transferase CsaB n=1 Tax=Proteocatella sphenisci TaxID=181070 RepID=UPI00048DDE64|nr:polysaccharide pyruvyl transferase CsaB [Proteocatella sphenisci]
MGYKILLSGYFGFDNVGDEAILSAMVKGIRKEMADSELVAMSANPELTARKNGIRAIDRMSIFAILKEMKNTDLFISGGGSLFQDVTSKRSILYYLGVVYLAKVIFRKKVMIYSQGIGPVNDPKNRRRMAKLFKKLDLINVRDNQSKLELNSMGVRENIRVSTDSVFSLEKPDHVIGSEILSNYGVDTTKMTLGVSVRNWKDHTAKIVEEVAKTIEALKDKDMNVVILPFHFPDDLELSEKIHDKLNMKDLGAIKVYTIKNLMGEHEFLSVMSNMDIMLSMRLHGLIFATVCNAYPIGISYDPKIQSLLEEMGREKALEVEDIDANILVEQLEYAMNNLEDLKEKTADTAHMMREKALLNNKMVKELLTDENIRG